ncbi:MAG TPA: gamma-glutamyl-gamma-aminobutyrate hydrolase family protein [Candidatus Xenobia bacterium]|jgi:gamma-glutamyl-gamma-aminobutyrate hydrolase PuuD
MSTTPGVRVTVSPRRRPVIGILVDQGRTQAGPVERTGGEWEAYADAVVRGGGEPRFICPDGRPPAIALQKVDGLLIPGGPDINPEMYGQTPDPSADLHLAPAAFDRWEGTVAASALEKGMPVRGICRGIQLLNIINRGTLTQDIVRSRPYPSSLNHVSGPHAVVFQPHSRLAEIYGSDEVQLTSHHHQSINTVGAGYRVTARALDGTIEGIETQDGRVIGVQSHPEREAAGLPFFHEFVDQARSVSTASPAGSAGSP